MRAKPKPPRAMNRRTRQAGHEPQAMLSVFLGVFGELGILGAV